jgi:very-short-patch-repair endonuclease
MPHRNFPQFQRNSARRLRSSMSEAEKRLWYYLRAHRFCGASFRRQTLIGPCIVDFVCHDSMLVIELDGGQHASARHVIADARRSEWLRSRGYKILRFWNSDVFGNIDGVLQLIAAELEAAPPSLLAAKRRRADHPHKGGGDRHALS